jgi:threonine synthase
MPDVTKALDTKWQLRCQHCGTEFGFAPMVRGCPDCAARGSVGLLEMERTSPLSKNLLAGRAGHGLDRWIDLLPVPDPASFLSLGAGGTALIPSRVIGKRLGIPRLYFKLEQQNPTLSFKDRFVAVAANAARSFGFRRIVVSSTGNLAMSVAAYAAALEMGSMIIVPQGTPANIVAEAGAYNARVVVIERELRFPALEAASRREDWFPLGLFLPKAVQNAFGVEGYRSFAYEIVEELGEAPGVVLFPCARGNGLYGAYKGFLDCRDTGSIDTLPRLVATQPVRANSIEVSLAQGTDRAVELAPFNSMARSTSETVASDDALRAIRSSSGIGLSADENEIRWAVSALSEEGLNVEASSSLPVACLSKLRQSQAFDQDRAVVCVLTASGLRWTETSGRPLASHVSEVRTIAEFEKVLDAA